jgi:hypothetical protein
MQPQSHKLQLRWLQSAVWMPSAQLALSLLMQQQCTRASMMQGCSMVPPSGGYPLCTRQTAQHHTSQHLQRWRQMQLQMLPQGSSCTLLHWTTSCSLVQ